MGATGTLAVRARGSAAVARWSLLCSVVVLLGVGCVRTTSKSPPPPGPTGAQVPPAAAPPPPALAAETKVIDLASVPGAHPAFAVKLTVPTSWEVEVVREIEALNFYDPAAPGGTPREKSQIFLRHFRARDFLTLSTVTVHERTRTAVAGRPAVTYIIEKKSGIPVFADQPSWRNARHRVTDIRLSDAQPSEFLVIGQRPGLPDAAFDALLASLRIAPLPTTSLVSPTRDFFSAVTKKSFGIFITPETSPVQPERFRGYHTGADAELPASTSVHAIAEGTVVRSGRVAGYGGLVAIAHTIGGGTLVGIYGHLDPSHLPRVGARVRADESIGSLGAAFTDETDGARAHLHFGLYGGPGVDVRGYVQDSAELTQWEDPLAFLQVRNAPPPTGGG